MAALHDDSSKVVCTEAQWNLVRVSETFILGDCMLIMHNDKTTATNH